MSFHNHQHLPVLFQYIFTGFRYLSKCCDILILIQYMNSHWPTTTHHIHIRLWQAVIGLESNCAHYTTVSMPKDLYDPSCATLPVSERFYYLLDTTRHRGISVYQVSNKFWQAVTDSNLLAYQYPTPPTPSPVLCRSNSTLHSTPSSTSTTGHVDCCSTFIVFDAVTWRTCLDIRIRISQ